MCTIRVKHVYCGTCDAYACGDDARADATDSRDVETAHARAKGDASSVDASDRRVVAGRRKIFSSRAEVTRARRTSRESGRRDGEARDRGRRAFASRAGGDDERIAAGERDVRR